MSYKTISKTKTVKRQSKHTFTLFFSALINYCFYSEHKWIHDWIRHRWIQVHACIGLLNG